MAMMLAMMLAMAWHVMSCHVILCHIVCCRLPQSVSCVKDIMSLQVRHSDISSNMSRQYS